ncbi:hypothetical protein BGX38DRAFT_1268146 [Terfezia claveryi]|nr:hypothetical protein BGX38DRAFT_1268146 [Terfezia claveryi]
MHLPGNQQKEKGHAMGEEEGEGAEGTSSSSQQMVEGHATGKRKAKVPRMRGAVATRHTVPKDGAYKDHHFYKEKGRRCQREKEEGHAKREKEGEDPREKRRGRMLREKRRGRRQGKQGGGRFRGRKGGEDSEGEKEGKIPSEKRMSRERRRGIVPREQGAVGVADPPPYHPQIRWQELKPS